MDVWRQAGPKILGKNVVEKLVNLADESGWNKGVTKWLTWCRGLSAGLEREGQDDCDPCKDHTVAAM